MAGDASERQFAAAGDALLDAIARGLRALRLPECIRLVGPVVPGATMAGGARIPGTSYELDPVRAAFCLGTLVHWPDDSDDGRVERPQLLATLGGVLAVADYLSRLAIAEAAAPLTVRDVLARLLESEAALAAGPRGAGDRRVAIVRATARAVASLLGQPSAAADFATADEVDDAASFASNDSRIVAAQRVGDANSRGVLLALREPATGADGLQPAAAASESAAGSRRSDAAGEAGDRLGDAARTRFEAVVTLTYPTAQANKLKHLLTSRRRLEVTPVDQFMALLVRN